MSPQPQQDRPPAIRIVPHIEGPRPLHFDIIEREVPEGVVIKIGRFTDKANIPNRVTFKSKVVSRGHAEIWSEGGKFLIRDTKSSSGTFLNHARLSPPNVESKPQILKDGDVVQLGVDYQGGTEEIYRCVKMRVELNRSWQRQVNPFSLNALKKIKQLTSSDASKPQTTDCCICLCGIGPFQALFVTPCSHVFHYKCIRPLLLSHHPGLLCPICRSYADLEAPIDNQVDWDQILAEQEEAEKQKNEKNGTNEENINENGISYKPSAPNSDKMLPPTPHKDNFLTQEISSAFETSGASSSFGGVPIPNRTRKTSNSSDEGDDQNLSRTLPSSLSTIPLLENMPPMPSNQNLINLDEIIEEDESTTSPPSSNSDQNQNNSTHESSSSASTSDNDDDAVIGLYNSTNKQTENSRVKGKGVERLRADRENVS